MIGTQTPSVGQRIEHHLKRALELGRLCSSDPVCAQHRPDDVHQEGIPLSLDEAIATSAPEPPPPAEDDWSDLREMVSLDEAYPFLLALRARGLETPELGVELKDQKGRPKYLLEIDWPSRRVAVCFPEDLSDDEQEALRRDGWTLLLFPCDPDDVPPRRNV